MATEPPKKEATPQNPAVEKLTDTNAVADFTSAFLGNDKPEAPKKPEEKPDKKPEEKKPAPRAKKPAPAPAAPQISADEIAEATARGVATALKKTEPEPEKEPESSLSDAEKSRVEALKQMEKSNPDKYKGIAKRYEESIAKFDDYATQWEKENKGKKFDEDAEEHKEFKASLEEGLDWDEDDYADARAEIKAKQVLEEYKKESGGKLAEIEEREKQRERLAKSAPAIEAAKVKNARDFMTGIGGEFKGLVDEKGVLNKELGEKLMAEDPVQCQIVLDSADLTEKLVETNFKLFNEIERFDPKNPIHVSLNNFILGTEQRLLQQPAEYQLDGYGRKFVASAEYAKLPEPQRKRVWTLTQPDIESLLVKAMLKQAKAKVQEEQKKFEMLVKAKGLAPANGNTNGNGHRPAIKPEPEEVEETIKPRTPVVQSAPRGQGSGGAQEADPQERFTKSFLGAA